MHCVGSVLAVDKHRLVRYYDNRSVYVGTYETVQWCSSFVFLMDAEEQHCDTEE